MQTADEKHRKGRRNVSETRRGKWGINRKSKQIQYKMLKSFLKREKKLSHCLMIVVQLFLKLKMKQNPGKDSKH